MSKYLLAILVIFFSACSSKNTSPYFLQATYDSGPSSSFAFRDDGTFQWTNGSGFGGFQTEGKYELKDHIIILDKVGFDNVIKTKRLLLTTIHPNSKQVGKYIVQVDDQNQVIDSMFIFSVVIDNRNLVK